jgi:hypothetical protein
VGAGVLTTIVGAGVAIAVWGACVVATTVGSGVIFVSVPVQPATAIAKTRRTARPIVANAHALLLKFIDFQI